MVVELEHQHLDWREVEAAAKKAGAPRELIDQAANSADPFAVLEWLVPHRAEVPADQVLPLQEAVQALLRKQAFALPPRTNGKPTPVVFGTGGHRGVIGQGLTLPHIQAIVAGLIHMIDEGLDDAGRRAQFGDADPQAIRKRGFVIGHDNRLFNPEFAFFTAGLLAEAGFRVRYAGRAASPELSLAVPDQGWAGSLNFTPSHNPFRWGGIKLSPADGGLAGTEITEPLAAEANRVLARLIESPWPKDAELRWRLKEVEREIERVDVHAIYLEALARHPLVRLEELIAELRGRSGAQALRFVADPVFGAAVPIYERLAERLPGVLSLLNTVDDPYFGGQTTEPNEQTLSAAMDVLRAEQPPFGVCIRNDPDSDRGLVGDAHEAIKMNRFAPLVMRYLMDLGEHGSLITTLPTSHQGPDYAQAKGQPVHVVQTGFKNFRELLKQPEALIAYEESDGMTLRGHTLDKDGVLAGLLAVRMVLHYGKPLSTLMADLEAETGRYHWLQLTFNITVPAKEAAQKLKPLAQMQPGQTIDAPGGPLAIREVDTRDGYKFTLEDGTWVMMRPSGTEPKIRVYAETRESAEATLALAQAGEALALKAMGLDGKA